MTFFTGILLASMMAIDYQPLAISRSYESNRPAPWADSIKNPQNADSPKVFAIIGNIEKFLTDRRIGVNIWGDRYELLYKRIY
jgi:hypothetical protein